MYEYSTLGDFRSFRCDAVIPTNNIAAKVLAQEVRDRGLALAVRELLTEAEGSELYSETVAIDGINFGELQSLLFEIESRSYSDWHPQRQRAFD